jgi:hypothetical protein
VTGTECTLRAFFDWYRNHASDDPRPWLIFGKGPSFRERVSYPVGEYRTLGLNHVLREQPVLLAHTIDVEVIEHCQDCLEANARFLVMPWVPHERKHLPFIGRQAHFGPSALNLAQWCERLPVLGRLAREGRLLWYNLHTAPPGKQRSGSPVVRAHGFSSTAAVRLLAMAGARRIRTLGIDGGNRYSAEFAGLSSTTLLQSWQTDYDMQFEDIARSIREHQLDFAPLGVQCPARIFVGTEPEQSLAFEVLRYSIQKHSSLSVQIDPLHRAIEDAGIEIPTPVSRSNRARTPFSFQRFAIPRLVRRQGRAIYLDSDMLVFRDIRCLWTWPFDGARVLSVNEPPELGRRPQFSVMVLDCAALDWDPGKIVRMLDEGALTYEQAMYEMKPAGQIAQVLPTEWNELERYEEGRTALLHYTDMSRQPWLTTDNPLARYWCETLFSGLDSGHISARLVEDAIRLGHVRPSLSYQIEHRITDPLLLPGSIRRQDRLNFVPPHTVPSAWRTLPPFSGSSSWSARTARLAYALVRAAWRSKTVRAARGSVHKIIRNLR